MVDNLAGIRVVEVGQVLAGPYAGAIFADLGAEVIKVERHDGGDDARNSSMPPRHRMGHPGLVPYEAFEAADGPFMICADNDRLFAKLAEVLGRTDWIADTRYVGNRGRLINKDALFAEMAPILARKPRAHWIAALDAVGVPATQIHSITEAQAQPQVQALGMALPVPGEDFALTGLPVSFDGECPGFARGAPRLGQDNALLGLSPASAE